MKKELLGLANPKFFGHRDPQKWYKPAHFTSNMYKLYIKIHEIIFAIDPPSFF